MVFDEIRNLRYLAVTENASVLDHRITVALNEELRRTTLGKLAVAGVDVHALHHAERREIKIITRHLEIVVLRHVSVLHIFKVLLQVSAHDGELDIVHRSFEHLAISVKHYGLDGAIEVKHLDTVIHTGKCVSIDNKVSLVGNGFYIRHKQYVRF